MLPNIAGAVIVVATLEFGLMVLFEAGLSFLGLGVQPPMPSWGSILSVGRNYMGTAWWIVTFPGLCLFLLVLSINVIGDHMRAIGSIHARRANQRKIMMGWGDEFSGRKVVLTGACGVIGR